MVGGATRDASEIAVAFTRVLRGAGLNVPTSSTIAFGEAIACTGIEDRDTTYWAGRATLVRRPEDHELYDRAFAVFWEHARADDDTTLEEQLLEITLAVDNDEDEGPQPDTAEASDDPTTTPFASVTEKRVYTGA